MYEVISPKRCRGLRERGGLAVRTVTTALAARPLPVDTRGQPEKMLHRGSGCSHHKTLLLCFSPPAAFPRSRLQALSCAGPNFYTGVIFEVCPRPTTAATTTPWGGREPSHHKSVLVSGRGVGDGMGRGSGELAPSPFSSSAGKRPGCTLGPCSDPGPFRGRPVPLHNPTGSASTALGTNSTSQT